MWCFTSTCLVRLLLKRLVAISIAHSSLIIVLPSIGGVKKPFTCRRERSSFTTSASTTYSDSDYACSRGGGKKKKSDKDSESGDKTTRPDCYFCLGSHKASECPNLRAGFLVATSARPSFAARGAPCERHEDEYWVADSGATENITQDASNLEDYTPPPPGEDIESANGVFLPVAGYGRLRLLVDQDNGTFKGATRELNRVAHVPELGRHNLLSAKRLTTAFDAPMRVYPATATIEPHFGRKTLVFRSLAQKLRFGSPQVSDGSKRDEVIERGLVPDAEFVWRDTGVEGGCRTTV